MYLTGLLAIANWYHMSSSAFQCRSTRSTSNSTM